MTMASATTGSENPAKRRAQMASRDAGSTAMRRTGMPIVRPASGRGSGRRARAARSAAADACGGRARRRLAVSAWQIRFSAVHSAAESSGRSAGRTGGRSRARAIASIAAARSRASGWLSRIFAFGPDVPAMRVRIGAERARVARELDDQLGAEGVGRRFGLARIGGLQHRAHRYHRGPAAAEVADQHAEQERQPGRLHHRPHPVAVGDVAHLVRDHAGELVGVSALSIEPSNT